MNAAYDELLATVAAQREELAECDRLAGELRERVAELEAEADRELSAEDAELAERLRSSPAVGRYFGLLRREARGARSERDELRGHLRDAQARAGLASYAADGCMACQSEPDAIGPGCACTHAPCVHDHNAKVAAPIVRRAEQAESARDALRFEVDLWRRLARMNELALDDARESLDELRAQRDEAMALLREADARPYAPRAFDDDDWAQRLAALEEKVKT